MASLLGIDSGLTYTKAVLFDEDGTPLAVARRKIPQLLPAPRRIERDLGALWHESAAAIREAIAISGRNTGDIKAVAATGHGDGAYLLDRDRRPLGSGILSLDSRAGSIVDKWKSDGIASAALALTGQEPHASAPSTLLAWLKQHEPDRYARIGHLIACKDWLRFRLCGEIGTDRTEASTSFTDYRTQDYAPASLDLYGLAEIAEALPPVSNSDAIVGEVTADAADLTGLAAGTPVAAGLHDVTASALGIGGHEPGLFSVIAGTYSINEVVSESPAIDRGWYCRNGIRAGTWNNMAISPASTANYEWFLDTFCKADQERAKRESRSIHDLLAPELEQAQARSSDIIFHPFLFGSPYGSVASAGFFGLHGWHDRGDVLKAIIEGIVFNHRTHIETLRWQFGGREVRIAGGVSRNDAFAQLFADAFNLPVLVTASDEAGAFGAALCGGAAIGLYPDPMIGARRLVQIQHRHEPQPQRVAALDERFSLYRRLAETMHSHWAAIEALADAARKGTPT
jgi:L-xylulokinase